MTNRGDAQLPDDPNEPGSTTPADAGGRGAAIPLELQFAPASRPARASAEAAPDRSAARQAVPPSPSGNEPAPPARPPASAARRRGLHVLLALLPLVLIVGVTALLLKGGPAGVFPGEFPPIEDLTVSQAALQPGRITLVVTNGGPDPVTIQQVLVDEAYWEHTVEPSRTLERLDTARVRIPYPWIEGEPHTINLVTASGLTFEHVINVATESPAIDGRFLGTFAMLGLYIGVVPVLLGMTWRPFLRSLKRSWLHFFLAFTAGILVFLGVDTIEEALEQSQGLPTALGGVGVVTLGALGSFALIMLASHARARRGGDSKLIVATTVAAGIGLHNLGEGLAVGSAYRLGEIALGTFLVIGFALHNTTEGLGIVSILGDKRVALLRLVALGLLAGIPTIFGAYAGAFFFSPLLATIFLAVAAGAIAQVVVEVMRIVRRESPGGLGSLESLAGIAVGVAVMYLTGLLVAA